MILNMTDEFMARLAEEASIVLATNNHSFEGDPLNAAEYTYFKAIREGRYLAPYWITQAFEIEMIANWIDLTNPETYELAVEKEEDNAGISTETQRPDNEMVATVGLGGAEQPRRGTDQHAMDGEGSHEAPVENGNQGTISEGGQRHDGERGLIVEG
jgi:hypothetical protein